MIYPRSYVAIQTVYASPTWNCCASLCNPITYQGNLPTYLCVMYITPNGNAIRAASQITDCVHRHLQISLILVILTFANWRNPCQAFINMLSVARGKTTFSTSAMVILRIPTRPELGLPLVIPIIMSSNCSPPISQSLSPVNQ